MGRHGEHVSGGSGLETTRRRLLQATASGAAGLSLSALLAGRANAADPEGRFPSHPRWRFVFINHVTTNPFFTATRYGIEDANALLGCTYQWTGSKTSNVTEMVDAFETAIASRPNGIATTIVDPTAFNAPVQKALQAGIPVVAYNADAPASSHNARMAYIGQDLFLSGVRMGERIVELVKQGDVVGFIATPGQLNIQPRIDGAKSAIQKSGAQIRFTEIATGPTLDEELSRIEAYYLGHKTLKGMFAVDAGSTQGVSQIVAKYGLAQKGVHSGGFDLLPITLQEINKGNLDFTIDQQPYLQGIYPVVELFLYNLSGGLMSPSDIDTGLKFITKATVKPYLAAKTRFEGSSTAEKVVPLPSGPA